MATEAPITPAQFLADMLHARNQVDRELRHQEMDTLMLTTLRSLGYGAGCDVFIETEKWYA